MLVDCSFIRTTKNGLEHKNVQGITIKDLYWETDTEQIRKELMKHRPKGCGWNIGGYARCEDKGTSLANEKELKLHVKLVLLRIIVDAYKWYGKELDKWGDVCSLTGVDTIDAELGINAVRAELEQMMERLSAEIKALRD